MTRIIIAGLAASFILATTAACGEAEEVLGNAARAAGCTAAEQAVSPIRSEARSAVEQLGVNPEAARRELAGLRNIVEAALPTLSGEARESLQQVSDALGTLTDEARDATRGVVDQRAVQAAQDELGTAIDEFTTVC